MSAIASQITCVVIVCSTVCWRGDHRKNQRSTSLAFVRGIHQWLVDSPHKRPVMQKLFPLDDVIVTGPLLQDNMIQCIEFMIFFFVADQMPLSIMAQEITPDLSELQRFVAGFPTVPHWFIEDQSIIDFRMWVTFQNPFIWLTHWPPYKVNVIKKKWFSTAL